MLFRDPQEGRSAIPKSTKPARIAENIHVVDFELTTQQLAANAARSTPECAADQTTHPPGRAGTPATPTSCANSSTA
jgi:diketogulonate reductase-like aldo/keto reductase